MIQSTLKFHRQEIPNLSKFCGLIVYITTDKLKPSMIHIIRLHAPSKYILKVTSVLDILLTAIMTEVHVKPYSSVLSSLGLFLS